MIWSKVKRLLRSAAARRFVRAPGLVGLVAGLSLYLIHIQWATLFLGVVPWAALAGLEALFFAGGAVLITLAYRWVPVVWPGTLGRALLLPVDVAGLSLRVGQGESSLVN